MRLMDHNNQGSKHFWKQQDRDAYVCIYVYYELCQFEVSVQMELYPTFWYFSWLVFFLFLPNKIHSKGPSILSLIFIYRLPCLVTVWFCDVIFSLFGSNDAFIIIDWLLVLHLIYIRSYSSRIGKKNPHMLW